MQEEAQEEVQEDAAGDTAGVADVHISSDCIQTQIETLK